MGKKVQGYCCICSMHGKLTNDHVPPQGSHKPSKVWIQSIAPTLKKPDGRIHRRHSQNGMKFRTICDRCNNTLLGTRYDPDLNHLSRKVGQIMRVSDRLDLPSSVPIRIKPHKVARAVIGHLLAAEEYLPKSPRTAPKIDAMRSYFTDDRLQMPDSLRLFFWPYRGRRVTILRGVAVMFGFTQVPNPPTVVGDFLKYFPAAFWLTSNAPESVTEQIKDREICTDKLDLDDEIELAVPTQKRNTFRADWPESPQGYETILLDHKSCVYAEPG